MEHYFIWSKKWTRGEYVRTFWRPEEKGYTIDLNQAGIYNLQEIKNLGFPILTKKTAKRLKYTGHYDSIAVATDDIELLGRKMECILN